MSKIFDKKILVIILIFLISIFIRYENIFERPLGFHNEDAPAHVLVTMKAFDESPINTHYFLPIFTLGNEHNKWIDNLPSASKPDEDGNYFYTSFPPLGFIAPYLFSKVFFLPIDVITLRLFNLLLSLMVAILVFVLVKKLIPIDNRLHSVVPLLSCGAYLFMAESLWSHGNAYWAHSLLQPLWLLSIYFFLRILEGEKSTRNLFGFGIVIFLMCYTEWTSYIIAILYIVVLGYLYLKRKCIEFLKATIVAGGASFFSGMLMVTLFSVKVGLFNYLEGLTFRASQRQGGGSQILALLNNYWLGYGLFLIALLILVFVFLIRRHEGVVISNRNKLFELIIFLTWVPVVENFLLIDHAATYTFATLKLSIPIIFSIAYLLCLVGHQYLKLTIVFWAISVVFSVYSYFDLNVNKNNNALYQTYVKTGNDIMSIAAQDEIALINIPVRGHIVHYSGRNIITSSFEDAVDNLKHSKFNSAKLFIAGGNNYSFGEVDNSYEWLFYGYLSGYVQLTQDGIEGVTVIPARYTDANWNNGISKGYNGFFVHNQEILLHLKKGDVLADQNDKIYKINEINNEQVWFDKADSINLGKATSFKLFNHSEH